MPKNGSNSAEELIPKKRSLRSLRVAAADCRACDLWEKGTQTVFGEGPRHAAVLFVGEQPGNDEDLTGKPFVGPAGRLLNEALAAAGIDRSLVYLTNVVKHFSWEPPRQTTHSQKAHAVRDSRLPTLAAGRDCVD